MNPMCSSLSSLDVDKQTRRSQVHTVISFELSMDDKRSTVVTVEQTVEHAKILTGHKLHIILQVERVSRNRGCLLLLCKCERESRMLY